MSHSSRCLKQDRGLENELVIFRHLVSKLVCCSMCLKKSFEF